MAHPVFRSVTRRGFLTAVGTTAIGGILLGALEPTAPFAVVRARDLGQVPVPANGSPGTPAGGATSNASPAAAAAAAAFVQQGGAALVDLDYSHIDLRVEQLAANVYALTGSPGVDPGHPEAAGGRIGFLTGPDGVFVVDAQYAPLTAKVVAAIRNISTAPIKFLVNTHEHPDHTGGNANFARLGALVLGREQERADLAQSLPPAVASAVDQKFLQALQTAAGDQNDPLRLPVATYGRAGEQRIRLNGETINLIPAPSSHTRGDTFVQFEAADVMLIGDVYRNYGYPFVDSFHGGSTNGILQALDVLMGLAGPDTRLVPGHGGIISKSDIPPHREMIVSVQARVKELVEQRQTLDEVLDSQPTSDYDAAVEGGTTPLPGGGTSADRFVSTIYNELKQAA